MRMKTSLGPAWKAARPSKPPDRFEPTVLNELSREEGDIPGGHWFRRRRVGGCKGASGHFHHIDIPAPLAGPRAEPRTPRLPFAARHTNHPSPPGCPLPPGRGPALTRA